MLRVATLAIIFALTTSCASAKRLGEALQSLDLPPAVDAMACELYAARGRELAEDAWRHDWQVFEPIFRSAPDPERDEQACRGILRSYGVTFHEQLGGRSGATAVCNAVFFEPGFEKQPADVRAATTCHELAHIVSQRRVGCARWLASYPEPGVLVWYEGIAYAVSDAMHERHGWSGARIDFEQRNRAERFPTVYNLWGLIEPACVLETFGGIRAELKARSGF